jgi:hypothetical protein
MRRVIFYCLHVGLHIRFLNLVSKCPLGRLLKGLSEVAEHLLDARWYIRLDLYDEPVFEFGWKRVSVSGGEDIRKIRA